MKRPTTKLLSRFTALFLAAGLLTGCTALQPGVDATPYVSLAYAGYNGEGTAALQVDEAGLYDALYKAMGLDATPESGSAEAQKADAVADALTLAATPESGLSNGDNVQVTGSVDAEALKPTGMTLTFKPFTDIVEGLDTTRPVDPFSNVTVMWDGYAPDITMLLNVKDAVNEPWSWVSYRTDANTDLSPGDVVTVRATADAETLENLGYELSTAETAYTVPDYLGNYLFDWQYVDAVGQASLQSKSNLTAVMLGVNRPAGMKLGDLSLDEPGLTFTNFALDKSYLLTSKSGARGGDDLDWYNALVCTYRFDVSSGDGESLTAYAAFALPDITLSGTGLLMQSEDAYYFHTAATDPAALGINPDTEAYRLTAVDFRAAATLETAQSE